MVGCVQAFLPREGIVLMDRLEFVGMISVPRSVGGTKRTFNATIRSVASIGVLPLERSLLHLETTARHDAAHDEYVGAKHAGRELYFLHGVFKELLAGLYTFELHTETASSADSGSDPTCDSAFLIPPAFPIHMHQV